MLHRCDVRDGEGWRGADRTDEARKRHENHGNRGSSWIAALGQHACRQSPRSSAATAMLRLLHDRGQAGELDRRSRLRQRSTRRGVAQGRHRDDRAASQQQKQAAHARSATAKPLYATLASASLLGFNGSAASSSVGNTTPTTSSASYSSLASLSSSGDFEIGSTWLRADILAGLTLWGILVPEAIAYAVMARAPPQAGLYTLLASLLVYAVLGTTRQAVSASTSGSSIMMAAVVAPFLVTNPNELGELLVLLVLVAGIIFLLCGVLRLGFITAFISHSVMTGFIFGLAIHIAVSQAPKIFGLPRFHGETVYQLWHLIGQLGGANWVTFA